MFLTAVGGMAQYAREDEPVQLQTVSALLVRCVCFCVLAAGLCLDQPSSCAAAAAAAGQEFGYSLRG